MTTAPIFRIVLASLSIATAGFSDDNPRFSFHTAALDESEDAIFIASETDGAPPIKLEFPLLERSPVIHTKSNPLILLRMDGEGKIEHVAEIELTPDQPTLIARIPPRVDEDRPTYHALPDPFERRYGTYRAVNLTGKDLIASLGEEEAEIPNMSDEQLGSKFTGKSSDPIPYQLWHPDGDRQVWIERKTVKPHRDKYILLFYHSKDPDASRLRASPYGITAFRPTG